MIVFGTCLGRDRTRYDGRALPAIQRIAHPDDLILTASGEGGICRAYNELLDRALREPRCKALVLSHDDVEITDPEFRDKLLGALDPPGIAIAGVVGGAGLRDLAWWHARRRAGAVFETRGYTKLGPKWADVDVVDGLLMAFAPRVLSHLRFDEKNFPAFHGYDADICLQARGAGFRVVVRPLEVVHRTKGGYGDTVTFRAAANTLARKWPQFVQPGVLPLPITRLRFGALHWMRFRLRRQARAAAVAAVRRLHASSGTTSAPTAPPSTPPTCPVCRRPVQTPSGPLPAIVECGACGVGVTSPPPTRDVESNGIFKQRYGGLRLLRRPVWDREARLRVTWLKLWLSDGVVLDVGAATGEFVKAAATEGYEAFGVEVSEWAAGHARRRGAGVVTGYLHDWLHQRPGVRPDAVTMWHVLEHIPDPAGLLRQVARLVGPDGLLLLEVPNFDSTEAQRLGLAWDSAQPTDHFHHFRPAGLRGLLEQSGWRVEHLLPMSTRVYRSTSRWNDLHNDAALEGRPWPPLDLLRAVARVAA